MEADIVILHEPFIGTYDISHMAFNLNWLQAKMQEIKIIMVVQNKLTNKIVVEYRMDLINHLYVMLFEIRKLDPRSIKPARKKQVVNVYHNQIERVCTWDGSISYPRRVLEDIECKPVIQGRVMIAGDSNTDSLVWNQDCPKRQIAAILNWRN